jgi:single-stranded-DNA-specific exonuclease
MVPLVWEHLTCDTARSAELADALHLHPLVARLLCLRGLTDPDQAARFLAPSLDHLWDPFRLTGVTRAVDRLLEAIAGHERIAIHGDYDVDGITSTVILRRTLELLGADVIHFVPDRIRDGYDLQTPAVERLAAEGAGVIVSVDCGTRGIDAARRARELGVDLIITDHHEPDSELPPALAVINPRRPDCTYPEKHLAGVGVTLKLVQGLCLRTGHPHWVPSFLKMAAIGTLADVVPLVGENRVIAKIGLDMLSRGPHKVGLRALLHAAGLAGRTIDSYQVAFMLAPRVNAAGRMSTPDIATRLLLASDEGLAEEARELAAQLNSENLRRQQEEQAILGEARRIVEGDPDVGARSALVVAGEGWHRGVIGIVASKLVDTFYRPAIVLSIEDGVAHGSCRSIPAFDMLGALEHCASWLTRFGGHRQAAGLTLAPENVKSFREAVTAWADEVLSPDDLRPRLRIDASLPLTGITGELVEQIVRLEPFGPGNPRPVFHANGVRLVDGPRRLKDRHLKMAMRQGSRTFRAVAWRAADREAFFRQHRDALDLAFSLVQSEYNGETAVELTVADARRPAATDNPP